MIENSTQLRVLVVDDEPEIRELICEILDRERYQYTQACNGAEALKKYQLQLDKSTPFDLILVDLKMPISSGESLIKTIRETDESTPIIVLTGHGDLSHAYLLLEKYNIADFLTKPIDCSVKLLFSLKNNFVKIKQQTNLKAQNSALNQQVKTQNIELTSIKDNEKYLSKMAYTDGLTGISNRELFLLALERELAIIKRHNKQLALLFIDLDSFKSINDTFGHSFGDEVLIEVGKRLKKTIRQYDIVARLGGDEFVVLLTNIEHVSDCQIIRDKISNILSYPMTIKGEIINLCSSIGFSCAPEHGYEADVLLDVADKNMYCNKKNK